MSLPEAMEQNEDDSNELQIVLYEPRINRAW